MLSNKDRPLAGLMPGDPRNLLSYDARVRLNDAVFLQQSIRDSALANIVARCGSNSDDWDGAAKAQWSNAKVRAGVAGLSPVCQELMAIGKQGSELWSLMDEELRSFAHSCELSGMEKQAVHSQLWLVRIPTAATNSVVARDSETDLHFATVDLREEAVRRVRTKLGKATGAVSAKQVAAVIGVQYNDLRKWVRKRGELLGKNHSARVVKIEIFLLSIL